ncbi:hypothetical protein [Subtercola vilae]|uniref:Uncharacterized protein n=1 Tax=Subtercola vilae TaxID=2056433 RepID=A0A4T2BQC2_9MICO|nr:hypothetical protein [Subtercola vilae]TIH33805.1 hypothetical protein D4765_14070 [Subtercola vilae]
MPRLISLPDKHDPSSPRRIWFNPEHVVSLIPKFGSNGTRHTFTVEIKLTGIPAMDAWLGDYGSRTDADNVWRAFLTSITTG